MEFTCDQSRIRFVNFVHYSHPLGSEGETIAHTCAKVQDQRELLKWANLSKVYPPCVEDFFLFFVNFPKGRIGVKLDSFLLANVKHFHEMILFM